MENNENFDFSDLDENKNSSQKKRILVKSAIVVVLLLSVFTVSFNKVNQESIHNGEMASEEGIVSAKDITDQDIINALTSEDDSGLNTILDDDSAATNDDDSQDDNGFLIIGENEDNQDPLLAALGEEDEVQSEETEINTEEVIETLGEEVTEEKLNTSIDSFAKRINALKNKNLDQQKHEVIAKLHGAANDQGDSTDFGNEINGETGPGIAIYLLFIPIFLLIRRKLFN